MFDTPPTIPETIKKNAVPTPKAIVSTTHGVMLQNTLAGLWPEPQITSENGPVIMIIANGIHKMRKQTTPRSLRTFATFIIGTRELYHTNVPDAPIATYLHTPIFASPGNGMYVAPQERYVAEPVPPGYCRYNHEPGKALWTRMIRFKNQSNVRRLAVAKSRSPAQFFEEDFEMYKCRAVILSVALLFCALAGPVPAWGGWLYVLNDDSAGSNIYGFQVNESTGALTPLSGFPVSPGNGGINSIVSERMVVDAANARLYVVNDSSDTVAAYSINRSTGAITLLPFSPIALGTGNWNSIAVHPGGTPLIVSNGLTSSGSLSFTITPTTATPAVGNPFLVGATSAFSSTFSRDGSYFYVGGNTGTVIAGFSVNTSNGVLTALSGSPFPAGGTSTIAYSTDTSGRLFGVDNAFNIRVFTSAAGVLSPVSGNPFPSGMTQRRFGLVHPNQNFYIIAGNTGNNVGVYQISGSGAATTVAAVPGSPFATGGTTANCLALNSSGNFLYVGNRISRNVTTFSVNTSTGALTQTNVQPSNTLGTVGAINGIGYLGDAAAVNAQVGGRVTDVNGRGVGRVSVQLSDAGGTTILSVLTSPFGYYNFPAVLTGSTYTLTPTRKGTTFTPPSITFSHTGDVTNQNFVAN